MTPLTIETLAENSLYSDTFVANGSYDVKHISIAEWADALVVAPATANIIGKFANGIADDALSTLLLATKAPIFIAPAMNSNMYENEAVKKNLNTLRERGVHIIEPQSGHLACGSCGIGRMDSPENIFQVITDTLRRTRKWENVKAVVTAGPTYEAIDPVRFIGNHSSGRMGFALAEELANGGAEVTLIAGPTSLSTSHPSIHRIDVTSASDMAKATLNAFANCHLAIMSAAVADYTPKVVADQKIKKNDDNLVIELVKTTDILKSLGAKKKENQTLVGFALETENELSNATNKLKNKNADYIVLNSLQDAGAGFGYDTNKVTILDKSGNIYKTELKSKREIAREILEIVTKNLK
ncbi:MAG: bifunctional phosphopantothenoylcysteine decarboxylase/phosphopantothenate--cysteine ligase CoaBC [Bacteroidales bacterium]|nr:bifunctional phosphopantothenoylcysteine decarboxylase/phosphopantothenate--cysteine ligase CoaBC [Bacteroidales bacterium]